ncbi:MAG TPA: TerC family protein [Longimicrobiales bacterium]|nr:TerC family protein [Longimicrobiales bacterium]
MENLWLWIGFNAFVLVMLALDLGIFHRRAHAISLREAILWSAFWIALSLVFNAGVYHFMGPEKGLEFLTGYLIEKSLSVDNIFVFVLIFSYFQVPAKYQHRVLFWGILGALVMRGAMIGTGIYLLHRFDWLFYVFGAFLVLAGLRMAKGHESVDPSRNPMLRLVRGTLPVSRHYRGQRLFFTIQSASGGRRIVATPLFVVLVLVETTDLVFAVDSIPAIFAVTRDPFIVYSSNVFAILGLRALYFVLAGVIDRFRYLKYGLSMVLVFVGTKMLLEHWVEIPVGISLGVIGTVLAVSVAVSLLLPPSPEVARAVGKHEQPPPAGEPGAEEAGRELKRELDELGARDPEAREPRGGREA